MFGVGLDDFNFNKISDRDHRFEITGSRLQYKGVNELGQVYYKCDWLAEDVWKNGFVCLSDVSWKTCAYVARYVKKKDLGLVQDAYNNKVEVPEFSVMSRNPGIGSYYPIEHPEYVNKTVFYFSDQEGVTQVRFPSFFLNALKENDYKRYLELKEQRKKFSDDKELSILWQTDLASMEIYDREENNDVDVCKVLDFYRSL